MITEIFLENFKSIRKLNLPLGQVQTVLVGPNGSGKSSVLQALYILAQSSVPIRHRPEPPNRIETRGPYIDLGPVDTLINRDSNGIATIGVRARASPPLGFMELHEIPFEFLLQFSSDVRWTQKATFDLLGAHVTVSNGPGQEGHVSVQELPIDELKFGLRPNPSIGSPISVNIITAPKGTEVKAREIQAQLSEAFDSPRRCLEKIYPVPSQRGFDRYEYAPVERDRPVDQMVTNEGTTELARFTASLIAYKRLESRISPWMKSITGVEVKPALAPGPTISVETTGTAPVNMVNEGFGTNQLVFLLAQLARSPPNSLVVIEEPEAHLHPRAQALLSDLLTEVAKTERKQIILATHSDHVVFRLLTQVAEARLHSPEDIGVYAFQRQNSTTEVSRLKVDDKGRIEGGLHDFFEADAEGFQKFLGAVGA
jgi:energy-coupling factor transporter ATP-binding protein EcfA2